MKLWRYLKEKFEIYKTRMAFPSVNITYADLLSYGDCQNNGSKLAICEGNSRIDQAIQIIRCIACGNVAIPITEEYGVARYKAIKKQIADDDNDYSDLAFIMFTSGTTGEPKGIMLTDENIITNLEYIGTYFDLTGRKRLCIGRPLVHIAVLTGELLYGLINGLEIYFYEGEYNPFRMAEFLRERQIDVFCATPTLYYSMLMSRQSLFISTGVVSGERLTESMAIKLAVGYPQIKFYNVYGLTEHSPRVSALLPEEFVKRAGSIGKPIGQVQLKIESGELLVKSPCVMKGYYRKTTSVITDGWLHTGDCAHVDESGYYYIDGRIDDMIIRAGVNFFPQEAESILKEFPGLQECEVYGKEDERYGQRVCLRYSGNIDLKSLKIYAAEKLPSYMRPMEYHYCAKFSYTPSGKLIRKRNGN